jgi:hypothetical protein
MTVRFSYSNNSGCANFNPNGCNAGGLRDCTQFRTRRVANLDPNGGSVETLHTSVPWQRRFSSQSSLSAGRDGIACLRFSSHRSKAAPDWAANIFIKNANQNRILGKKSRQVEIMSISGLDLSWPIQNIVRFFQFTKCT